MNKKEIEIQPIAENDILHFYHLIENNRNHLKKYFPKTLETITDFSSAEKFVIQKMMDAENKNSFYFTIKFDDKISGIITLRNLEWEIPKGEIGYFIDKKLQGNGIATIVVRKFLKFCFEELNFEKVYAKINKSNVGSIKTIEKNGFKKEGTLRNDFRDGNGNLLDSEYYSILKEEYCLKTG